MTSTVFSESNSLRSDTSSFGFVLGFGIHHFTVRFWRSARSSQLAMLASWSSLEMIISDPVVKDRAKESVRKRTVVEEPRTVYVR